MFGTKISFRRERPREATYYSLALSILLISNKLAVKLIIIHKTSGTSISSSPSLDLGYYYTINVVDLAYTSFGNRDCIPASPPSSVYDSILNSF